MTNAKLTQDELQAIKDRANKATAGPWYIDGAIEIHSPSGGEIVAVWDGGDTLDFIANARQDIPRLVAEVERLRAEIKFVINADMTPETKDASQLASEIKLWAQDVIGGESD